MVTISELEDECREIHGFADSLNNCGYLNSCVSAFLDSEGVDHTFVRGEKGSVSWGGSSAPHQFIVVPSGEIDGVDEEVVVDVTINQFCTENEGAVSVSLASVDELPKVAIVGEETVYSGGDVDLSFDVWSF